MFIDQAVIKIESGKGGNGAVAWRREKHVPMGGPAGGNGGNGGNVVVQATHQLTSLLDFTYKTSFKAEDGEHGRTKNQHGKNGKDLIISVPVGTILKDHETGHAIADLHKEGDLVIVAKGGKGGYGNSHYVTPTNQAPSISEPGEPAIRRILELELKLIADVGIIGKPNAGKSTFISVVSAAKPKIADYPFTTLEPNLGVVKDDYNNTIVLADIPGLIEGASEGVGLGHQFLRHVERCKLLLHLIDVSSENPLKDFETINYELNQYGKHLAKREQVIVLTKVDAVPESDVDFFKEELQVLTKGAPIYSISSLAGQGVRDLINLIVRKSKSIAEPNLELEFLELETYSSQHEETPLTIDADEYAFYIDSSQIKRLASVTNIDDHDSLYRFENTLRQMGVFKKLKDLGIHEGATIIAGGLEFEYYSDDMDFSAFDSNDQDD